MIEVEQPGLFRAEREIIPVAKPPARSVELAAIITSDQHIGAVDLE